MGEGSQKTTPILFVGFGYREPEFIEVNMVNDYLTGFICSGLLLDKLSVIWKFNVRLICTRFWFCCGYDTFYAFA